MTDSISATNRPYLAMGLTFLLLGIGFANPWPLVLAPPPGIWEGKISFEVLNLYSLLAFLGLAHFFYAWHGQWRGSKHMSARRRWTYWAMVAVTLAVLVTLRGWMGVGVFSLLVWTYNISHFIKTEVYFASQQRSNFYSPSIAFAWFTLTLFPVGPLHSIRLVFVGTILLAAVLMVFGDWKALANDKMRLPLLTLFLLGETLVWSAYSPYMTDAFRIGVYVFHIAAAGFYHYLSTYFYANSHDSKRWLTSPTGILTVNLLFIAAGCAIARWNVLRWASFVFAPVWFTLWVGFHLAASDLMPWWKKRSGGSRTSPGTIVHAP